MLIKNKIIRFAIFMGIACLLLAAGYCIYQYVQGHRHVKAIRILNLAEMRTIQSSNDDSLLHKRSFDQCGWLKSRFVPGPPYYYCSNTSSLIYGTNIDLSEFENHLEKLMSAAGWSRRRPEMYDKASSEVFFDTSHLINNSYYIGCYCWMRFTKTDGLTMEVYVDNIPAPYKDIPEIRHAIDTAAKKYEHMYYMQIHRF